MKKASFQLKKWTARALMVVGASLGLSACSQRLGHDPAETVYGPPPDYDPDIEVIEDVYGPPSIENPDTIPDDQLNEPVNQPEHD